MWRVIRFYQYPFTITSSLALAVRAKAAPLCSRAPRCDISTGHVVGHRLLQDPRVKIAPESPSYWSACPVSVMCCREALGLANANSSIVIATPANFLLSCVFCVDDSSALRAPTSFSSISRTLGLLVDTVHFFNSLDRSFSHVFGTSLGIRANPAIRRLPAVHSRRLGFTLGRAERHHLFNHTTPQPEALQLQTTSGR